MHTEVSSAIQAEVRGNIDGSGIRDTSGRAKGWQRGHVGSGGGYAAVRPAGRKEGGGSGPNSAGAITSYLEAGHRVRPPSGNAKRLRKGRAKQLYVKSHHFYRDAHDQAQRIAVEAANAYAEAFVERLGD
jgi:hypothetical protein